MLTRLVAVLFLMLTLALSSALSLDWSSAQTTRAGGECIGLAVATAPLPPGSPLTTPVVTLTGPDGREAFSVDFAQPAAVWSSSLDAVSLLRSLGGEYGLLDAEKESVTPLIFPGTEPGAVDHRSWQFIGSSGKRFHLFGDLVTLEAWLVDLQTAAVLSISDLLDEPVRTMSAQVSADDHWLVFFTGRDSYLLDLTSSAGAQRLDSAARSVWPSFSADGSTIFYLREPGSENSEIVARDLAGAHSRILAAGGPWDIFRAFPGDLLFAWQKGLQLRIPLDGTSPIAIYESPEPPIPFSVDPTGSRLLLGREIGGVSTWTVAGTGGEGATELQSHAGLEMLGPLPVADWVLFAQSQAPLSGVPGTPYLSLELASGAVSTVLTQDSSAIYTVGDDDPVNGRFRLVRATEPGSGRLWLIDNQAGTSVLVGSSPGNASGSLSSDGCYLAVSTFAALGEGRQGQVEVRDLSTGEVTATIPDAVLLGWASLPR